MSQNPWPSNAAEPANQWPGTEPLNETDGSRNTLDPSQLAEGSPHDAAPPRKSFLQHTLLLGNLKPQTRAGIAILLSFLILVAVLIVNRNRQPATSDPKAGDLLIASNGASEDSQSAAKTALTQPLAALPLPPETGVAEAVRSSTGRGDTSQEGAESTGLPVPASAEGPDPVPGGPDPLPPLARPASMAQTPAETLGFTAGNDSPPPPPTAGMFAASESPPAITNVPPPMQIGGNPPGGTRPRALTGYPASAATAPTETRAATPTPTAGQAATTKWPDVAPRSGGEAPSSVPRVAALPEASGKRHRDPPPPETMPSDFSENASIPKITADWVTVPNAGKRAIQTGDSGAPLLAANVGTATARIATTPAETNDRIEPVRHVVQRDENFWTISRLYYGSGRYYKALWAANSDRVSAPEKLVVGMTIRIPPPEALDRSLVEVPSPSGSVSAQERLPQRPLNQGNDPNNRPRSTSEIELALPVGSPTAASLPSPESDSQTLADSRAVANYPSYQVRPHDTLRSIARDTLGDARRAREIFEMNRDTISDQRQLTPGQHLVLPEDARLGRRSK